MGDGIKRCYESEKAPLYKMTKKLVAARDLPAGHTLSEADIAIKAPNDGLPAHEYDNVLGMRLTVPVKADENLSYDILERAAATAGMPLRAAAN
jgi:N-acetylneuraminate synthase/sialic acid synthase